MRKGQIFIAEITASLLILLFLYTAFSKLASFRAYITAISESPLIKGYSEFVAIIIPVIEILISILLFIPRYRKNGFILSTFLMLLFTVYIAFMLAVSADLPCSCGGVIQSMSWLQHLIFNIFFTTLSVLGWFTVHKNNLRKSKILLQ